MRTSRLLLPVLCTGCLYAQERYEARQLEICHPRDGCVESSWWPDEDGDGWGDGGREPNVQLDRQPGFVPNDLDCDDSDDGIAGRLGPLCPAEFAPGTVDVIGLLTADTEILLLRGDTQPLPVAFASDRCGPLGWGGTLGVSDLSAPLLTALETIETDWAGWLAASPADLPGGIANVEVCAGALQEGLPVALTAEACLTQTPTGYEAGSAHYICERPAADPEDYLP